MKQLSISLTALLMFVTLASAGVLLPHLLRNGLLTYLILLLAAVGFVLLLRLRLRADAASLQRAIADLPLRSDYAVSSELADIPVSLDRAAEKTERQFRKLEEGRHELEALLEGMQDAVVAIDAAARVQWSNAHMQRLMESENVGGSIRVGRALVHTLRDPVLLAAVQTTLDERTVTECRSESLLPGRIFSINASPLPGGGAVLVLHDISRAEAVERTQRDFVANVSHELRTPLTSIVGYVETLLEHEMLGPQAHDFLETILKNATRMHRLTEDLLVLARVEDSDEQLHREPVPAESLVRDALRTVSGTDYADRAHFEIRDSLATAVYADEHAILQVLGNLMENAVKYGAPGRGAPSRVVVGARIALDSPRFIEFSVQDFGPGIASEHLPRIFERFYRVDKARSRESGGTGLGLAIARHIIEEHEGRLWVESDLGSGSTFRFTLPIAEGELPAPPADAEASTPESR